MNLQMQEKAMVAEQAAHWMVMLRTGGTTEKAAFMKWLKSSPLHVHEMLVASRYQEVLRSIPPERRAELESLIARTKAGANISAIRTQTASTRAPIAARRFSVPRLSVAAALLMAVLLSAVWLAYRHTTEPGSYATQRGEQRVISLDDGSVVWLNTDSRMRVRYGDGARDILLDRGQALFQVQHDAARPFRVHAASAVVQAIGTQFDVRLMGERTVVAVVEGAVQVSAQKQKPGKSPATAPAPSSARVTAGKGAVVSANGAVEKTMSVDAKAVTAWRVQRLIFRDTPLSVIVNEFNRYNSRPRIRIEGEELRARQFDGAFDALAPRSFLAYLENEGVVVEHYEDEIVVR